MGHIIDISKNNGAIDFHKLVDIDEIFIRATMGFNTKDKSLEFNAKSAAEVGIPVSYYHFAYPDAKTGATIEADARAEAEYFVQTIKTLPKAKHLVVDLEPQNAEGKDTTLSPVEYALWLQKFLEVVESETGVKCIIYTYADYLNRHLPKEHNFGNHPLWIANYSAKANPPIPHGWATWYMWQYSCTGKIPGISTDVDLNKLNIV